MRQPTEDTERYIGKNLKKKPMRKLSAGLIVLLVLLLTAVRAGAEYTKLRAFADLYVGGKNLHTLDDIAEVNLDRSLERPSDAPVPEKTIQIYERPEDVPESMAEGENYALVFDDGTTVIYNDHTYQLNRNLYTVLFMGIDTSINGKEHVIGKAGQADVILLLGIDVTTGKTTILNISREAYAQVEEYSVDNLLLGTRFEQLALAYASGNGKETSCENTMRSVSHLLYNLLETKDGSCRPYLALDLDGIQAANDALGGVTVRSKLTQTMPDGTELHEGDLIKLQGKNLERYIRTRTGDIDANAARMDRQKQYLTEFSKLAIARTKQDFTFPAELFSSLSPYMVTNLTTAEVTNLSSCFMEHGAEFTFRSVDGVYGVLNESAVLYLDEGDLFEAVLQMFYRRQD